MSTETPAPLAYDRKRLLLASCVAMTATAMTFSIRGDTLQAFGKDFGLSHTQEGYISLLGMWGFPIAILLVGPLCDTIGMGLLLRFAAVGHIAGTALTILSPKLGFGALLLANLCLGLSNGTVEAVTNPLVATMYPDQKVAKLNLLHAWWPGGMIIGGLYTVLINQMLRIPPDLSSGPISFSWKIKWAIVVICAVYYLYLTLGQEFPHTERVQQGVSNKEMVSAALVPGFLVLMACMCLTAVTELGPDQWVGSVLSDTVKIQGILGLVYAAGLMFVLRMFAGKFVHALSPIGMLAAAAAISAVGLVLLSNARAAGPAFIALTVFGIGKTFFWPTMIGVANERFPRTGALGMAVMGAAGMIAAGLAGPGMGKIYDNGIQAKLPPAMQSTVLTDGHLDGKKVAALTSPADKQAVDEAKANGAATTFRKVAVLPVIVAIVFAVMLVMLKQSGGYGAVGIHESGPPQS